MLVAIVVTVPSFTGFLTARVEIDLESSASHAAWSDVTGGPFRAGTRVDADMPAATPDDLMDSNTNYSGTTIFLYATGAAVSPDGHEVFFNLYMGQNAQGTTGDNCVFGGSFVAP